MYFLIKFILHLQYNLIFKMINVLSHMDFLNLMLNHNFKNLLYMLSYYINLINLQILI